MDITLAQNQVVWAKLVGFPWWPAYIKRIVSKELFEIEYFGEFERNYFDISRIKPFGELAAKVNQKNPRLMESFRQAMRIINNETTVEKEREDYFQKKHHFENQSLHLSKHISANDHSTNYSLIDARQVLNNSVLTELGNPTVVPIFADEGVFSNLPKTDKKIKKTSRIQKYQKQKESKHKLEIRKFKSMQPIPHLQSCSKGTEQIFFEESEVENVDKREFEEHFMEKENPIEELENILKEVKNLLSREKPIENEVRRRLDQWLVIFHQNESDIGLMFDSEIGKELREIVCRVAELSAKGVDLKVFHFFTLDLVKNVHEKLIFHFFQAESSDPPRRDLKIIQLPSNIVSKKQSFETVDTGYVDKFPHSSNSNIVDSCEIENNINFQIINKKIVEKKENDGNIVNEETAFKVCKKLAKLLYFELSLKRRTKVDSENAANQIEFRIRNSCKSHEEYKMKIVYLMKKLSHKRDRVLFSMRSGLVISRDLPIHDIVKSFLIKK